MNLIAYLLKSRGLVNSMQRLPTIATRFGVSTAKMDRALNRYVDIANAYGTVPTLAVTANLIERHPRVFERLSERGAELAIHGWVHTDYRALDADQQRAHIKRGLAAFAQRGIPVEGFRCPYVRWNEDSITTAKELGLQYGSNRTVAWDVVPTDDGISQRALEAYRKGLRLYGSSEAASIVSLPSLVNGLLDLPASLPDDEALVDRLRTTPERREQIWRGILDEVYALGEMFVLILHHERLALCRSALEAVLTHTQGRQPHVWLASLAEISAWWRRRAAFRLQIDLTAEGTYRIIAPDDPDIAVVARGVDGGAALRPWFGDYQMARGSHFSVRTPKRPAISVDEDASPALVQFLADEGYVVERGAGDCSLHLGGWQAFEDTGKRAVMAAIDVSDAPLVRIWRWPRGARCAMSLTGDVDSMTIVDFIRRPLEV